MFLATKTENQCIPIATFASKIKQVTPSDVLSHEFLVSQSLKFQYKVHHAFLALYGMFLDMQQALPDHSMADLERARDGAVKSCKAARLTDLEFLYTPSQIALACFRLADPDLTEAWLLSKHPSAPVPEQMINHEQVMGCADDIKKDLEAALRPVDLDAVRSVDKRLKFCRNPEKDPSSALSVML